MRKLFLAVTLAVLLVGTVGVSSAEAQWRRGRGYYYGYPAYSYPAYSGYYSPGYGAYYSPGYSYSSGYYGYPSGRGYRGWRR